MLSEFKFALSSLVKAPGFTLTSILILALGIGANTAAFSVVNAVLLQPLPFSRPAELFSLHSAATNQLGLYNMPEFCDYRDESRSFQGLAAIGTFNTALVDNGAAQFVRGVRLSANAFELLGVRPAAGRLLVSDDDRPGAARVAVIGHGLWLRSYGASPSVIGRTVTLNGEPHTIVGILPAGFVLPVNAQDNDICVPLQPESDPWRYQPSSEHYLRVIGRLAPGSSSAQALADLKGIWRELRRRFPKEYDGNGENWLTPLKDDIVGRSRPMLLTLLGSLGALALLATANLSGLYLVRILGRRREFAVRTALGCSQSGLVRLLLAECIMLTVTGCVGGLVLAYWGLHALPSLAPMNLPRSHDVALDGATLAFAVLVSFIGVLAIALSPVRLLSHVDIRDAISAGGRSSTGGPSQTRVRHFLASVQVALALTLLVCAILFMRSFWAVSAERVGFDPSNTLTARLSLPEVGYRDRDALIRYYEQMYQRIASIPGVEDAGVTSILPLTNGLSTVDFAVTGRPPLRASDLPWANYRVISPGYLKAMRIPLKQGRLFDERDDGEHPLSVVINAALADAYFPDRRALGERLQIDDTAKGTRTAQIVGVVGNVKQGKREDGPAYDVYIPYRQMDPVLVPWMRFETNWVLRTSMPPQLLEASLRREIRAVDPGVPVASVQTMEQVMESALAARRFTLGIIGFFAGTALLLTIAGTYAAIAYGVAQRTREIGIRTALGASSRQILFLVLGEGFGVVASGSIFGIITALGVSRLIATQLFGVAFYDPVALSVASTLLLSISLFACWLPARRAARLDPLTALRHE
jgi:putative ABC transport system permease protein